MVDAGKIKQLSYDLFDESTCLETIQISQACAKQRAGRAERVQNGFCYRIYSRDEYDAMNEYALPEILRVSLKEICLSTKLLVDDLSIEAFLVKALEPPPIENIRQSINLLKKIGALDRDENITILGMHLANLPVNCNLGKMILYAIIFGCLDPVLTLTR